LSSWENKVDSEGGSAEMVVDEFLRNFSADVISRASFGSSFSEGKEIFNKIRQLQMAMAKQKMLIGVPGSRYVKKNFSWAIMLYIKVAFWDGKLW